MVAKRLVAQWATLGVSNKDVQCLSPSSPIVSIELSKKKSGNFLKPIENAGPMLTLKFIEF